MFYIFRLTKGNDLKKSIVKYCTDNNIKAGIIGSCVGCCDEVNFRLAGGEKFYHSKFDNNYNVYYYITTNNGEIVNVKLIIDYVLEDGIKRNMTVILEN